VLRPCRDGDADRGLLRGVIADRDAVSIGTIRYPARVRFACLLVALVTACASAPVTPAPAPVATPPAPTPAPAPALPPGVLAEAQGVHGLVRVEEQGGLRLLTIAGVVQGAVPLAGAPLAGDPLVALVRAARPQAKRALVIGLGTGRTAAELAAAGLNVEVVEVEPAVVEFAKKFFDYTGHAAIAEGFAHARGRTAKYDVIVVDTLVEEPPQVLAEVYDRLGIRDHHNPVLLGVRLRGSPVDPGFVSAAKRTRYLQLWGAGAGDEAQTMYALVSPRPANILAPTGIPAWPIPLHFESHERPTVTAVPEAATARRVALLGYLIRAQEDGALCLDLPHQEMGAQRYRLRGAALAQLEPLLPKQFKAMTDGEIGLDGDTSKTLREVLGGGGWMRSDVRFSPVIVALSGVARVAAVVDPDAAPFVPQDLRGDAPTDPRLPYGGMLYDLDVETVTWTMDRAAWTKLRPKLTGLARQAASTLARGDFTATAHHLDAYLAAIDGAFHEFAPRFAVFVDIHRALDRLAAVSGIPASSTPGLRARACADLYDNGAFAGVGQNPDLDRLEQAALKCMKLGPHGG
jgi:hypothetical protein